jgi:Tfp pilus assembly protein PilV
MVNRTNGADRCKARGRRSVGRARHGFTLVELLIALILLDVGLLALVGTGAAIARESRTTRASAHALNVATGRLERSASLPCRAGGSGTAAWSDSITERWTETIGANGTRAMYDSASYPTSRGVRVVVLRMGARC